MSGLLKILLVTVVIGYSIQKIDAQQKTSSVFGTVLDHKNQPLAYVFIFIKDTDWGTYTSKKGKFTIDNIYPGTYTLIIPGIGFKELRKEINVVSGKNLSLVLTLEKDQAIVEKEFILFILHNDL